MKKSIVQRAAEELSRDLLSKGPLDGAAAAEYQIKADLFTLKAAILFGWAEVKGYLREPKEWKSVDDELPENADPVMAITKQGEYIIAQYVASSKKWRQTYQERFRIFGVNWERHACDWDIPVTHWMEIPKFKQTKEMNDVQQSSDQSKTNQSWN